jgi:hypothetical protein
MYDVYSIAVGAGSGSDHDGAWPEEEEKQLII